MPFALVFTGLMLVITGFQDTYKQFGTLVQGDFTGSGSNNFFFWMLSVIIVGSIGYIKSLEGLSRAFLGLIAFMLVVKIFKQNPQVFSQISSGISTGSTEAVNQPGTPIATNNTSGSISNGVSSGSNLLKDAGTVATIASAFF